MRYRHGLTRELHVNGNGFLYLPPPCGGTAVVVNPTPELNAALYSKGGKRQLIEELARWDISELVSELLSFRDAAENYRRYGLLAEVYPGAKVMIGKMRSKGRPIDLEALIVSVLVFKYYQHYRAKRARHFGHAALAAKISGALQRQGLGVRLNSNVVQKSLAAVSSVLRNLPRSKRRPTHRLSIGSVNIPELGMITWGEYYSRFCAFVDRIKSSATIEVAMEHAGSENHKER